MRPLWFSWVTVGSRRLGGEGGVPSPSDLAGGLRDGRGCGWGKPRPALPQGGVERGGGRNPLAATLCHHQAVKTGSEDRGPLRRRNRQRSPPKGKYPQGLSPSQEHVEVEVKVKPEGFRASGEKRDRSCASGPVLGCHLKNCIDMAFSRA